MSGDARELFSVKLTVEAGCEHFCSKVVLVQTDNKITQVYINHLDGSSPLSSCNAHDLLSMCFQAQTLLVTVHHPSKVIVQVDRLSCWKHNHTTIRLNLKVFGKLTI